MDAVVADGRKNGREPPGCRLDADDKPKLRLDAAPGKLPREVEEPVVSMDAAAEVVEAMAAAEAESGWL
jgi:hypothetical protein